jgi:hypothetical protein
VAVAGVQFQLDGVNLGAEITSAPFTRAWNSMTTTNGAHTLTAVARDSSGKTTTSAPVTINVNNDLTPPTVAITTPIDGASVVTTVGVVASASDNVGVVGVQFRLNGANFGTEITAPPYTVTWNSTLSPNGPYTWTAVARDAAGNSTISTAINVTVNNLIDTTPPTVSLTAPLNGATVSGATVTVSANASDNVGVLGVQFLVDGTPFGAEDTAAPYSIAWDSTSVVNGVYTLSARARDAAGLQTTSAGIPVTVSNTQPTGVLEITMTAVGEQAIKTTTVTSAAFSTTTGNQLLLAFIAMDADTQGNGSTGLTGAGLTWTLVVRTNAQMGATEIWRAFAPNPLTNVSVTATITQPTTSLMVVMAFSGVDTSGTNGSGAIGATRSASAATGAPTGTVTTTRAGSWVLGVGNDWDGAQSRTVGSGQVMVHQYLPWNGATYWVQRRTTTTPAIGNVTINDTAPTNHRWNLSIVEVKPRP